MGIKEGLINLKNKLAKGEKGKIESES